MPDQASLLEASNTCQALGTPPCPSGLLQPEHVPDLTAANGDLSKDRTLYRLDAYKTGGAWVSKNTGNPAVFPGTDRLDSPILHWGGGSSTWK